MNKTSESKKSNGMASDENETCSSWADKQDDVINHAGSPTMSIASNKSGDLDFSVGQKIEVRDYRTDMWYLAKIMEVDFDDREIFIHYEKWSQRFDEWMKWDSQRIRRASQSVPTSQFKIGDSVMATWNYTKKYPAVIQNILPEDKYEVKFYDGFVKVIRGNRITELNPNIAQSIMSKLPKEKPPAPRVGSELELGNIGTKEERREKKRRINVAEIFHPISAASSAKKRKMEEEAAAAAVAKEKVEKGGRRSRGGAGAKGAVKEEAPVKKEAATVKKEVTAVKKEVAAVKKETVMIKKEATTVKKEVPAVKKEAVIVKKETTTVKKEAPPVKVDKKRRSSRYKEELKEETEGGEKEEKKVETKEREEKSKPVVEIDPGFEPEKYPLEASKDEEGEKDDKSKDKLKDADVKVEKVEGKVNGEGATDEDKTGGGKTPSGSEPVQTTESNHQTTESAPDKPVESDLQAQDRKPAKDVKLKDILPNIASGRASALRRIRTPKVKTSLGSLTSSSFPRVKITQLSKPHIKSLTSRGGRVIKKKIPGGGFVETVVTESSSKINSSETSNAEKQEDAAPLPKIPKITIAIGKPSSSTNADSNAVQESVASCSEPKPSAVEKPAAETPQYHVKEEKAGEESEKRKSKKKKGKRMRHGRSKHTSEAEDGGDWKAKRGSKNDEEDDPERWSGTVPDTAKPVYIDGGDGKLRQSIIIPDAKLPDGWTKHTIIRKNSSKWDVLLVNAEGRKFRSRKDLRVYYNEINKEYPEDRFDFVVGRTKLTNNLIEQATKSNCSPIHSPSSSSSSPRHRSGKRSRSKESARPSSSVSSPTLTSAATTPAVEEKKIKTLLPKAKSTPVAAGASAATAANFADEAISPLPTVAQSLSAGKVTPKVGSLEASHLLATPLSTSLPEEGTGSCQCPKEGCGKNFRKESLLQMHIKHYHPEYSDFLDGALNVADLAYARTVGDAGDFAESGGDGGGGAGGDHGSHHSGTPSFLERITRYEQSKAAAAAAAAATATATAAKSGEVVTAAKSGEVASRRRSTATVTATASSPLRKALMKGISFSPERLAEDSVDPSKKSTSHLSSTSTPSGKSRQESTPSEANGERRTAADPNERLKPEELEKGGADSKPPTGRDSLQKSHTPPPRQKYLEGTTPDSPRTPSNTSYRFARNKPCLVSLEKLNLTPDSNGRVLLDKKGQDLLKSEKSDSNVDGVDLPVDAINTTETEVVDVINKKEEIINCMCGYPEEDGLMIQCDLCLCWQHGLCNNISTDAEVPEKYICYICLHSKHSRSSRKYVHNQEWLKDGKLPLLSFRQHDEQELQQRESLLKRSHELVSSLLQLQTVVKSLRLKTHIAGKSDHPKLYLWSKSWDKDEKEKEEIKMEEKETDGDSKEAIKTEEKKVPNIPVPEAPIDLVECRLRLLEHIENYQQQIDDRLSSLDAQVSALEAMDPDLTDDETEEFYPRSKQTVQMLLNDLGTLRKVTAFN